MGDDNNNNKGCGYDGGDCCGAQVNKKYCKVCKCIDPKNQGGKPTCGSPQYKGDGNCDDNNNNKGCGYDGGDCCVKSVGGAVVKKYCKLCKCIDPKNQGGKPACGSPKYKGDGNCDNKGCGYDGGDCCVASVKGGQVNKAYCKTCKCIDPKNQGGKPTCGLPQYKGDGNCDDANNNKGSGYDGGDCCVASVKGGKVNKAYCKACKCMDPKNKGKKPNKPACALPQYKGDGNCDDENNNKG